MTMKQLIKAVADDMQANWISMRGMSRADVIKAAKRVVDHKIRTGAIKVIKKSQDQSKQK